MPSIFSKNAIISGDVYFFCLVCEDKLKTEDAVNAHIQKVIHRKNFDQKYSYVKDYESESIGKHKNHEYNKSDDIDVTTSNKHAKWYENCIILFDNLLVTERAWNGLIDNSCAYCNIEFDNEELHKTESTHVLNLIQAQLLIGEKRSVYRKLDNHTFHCITCNEVLALSTESHFEQDMHDECYIQCRRNKKVLYDKTYKNKSRIETPIKQTLNEKISKKDDIIKPDIEHANRLCNINKLFKNEELSEAKITDQKPENDNYNVPELNSLEALVKKLDLNDCIYFNENGDPLCTLCAWDLSGPLDSVKAHIQGRHHQETLKLHKQRVVKEKREKTICGNQKETVELKNNLTATAVTEDNSKSESALKENDCSAILTEIDNETPITDIKSAYKTDIRSNVADLQKHAIAIDLVNEKAVCKKCYTSLPFEIEVIRNHIEQHSKCKSKDNPSLGESVGNETDVTKSLTRPDFMTKSEPEASNIATTNTITETNDEEKTKKDIIKFASENHIYYNFSSNQAYCRVCENQIPKGLTSMKKHVKGAKHASATSAAADGLAPEGASQTKKFCLQVIKKRPRKPDVADVHEWCSAATENDHYCSTKWASSVWFPSCERQFRWLAPHSTPLHQFPACHILFVSKKLAMHWSLGLRVSIGHIPELIVGSLRDGLVGSRFPNLSISLLSKYERTILDVGRKPEGVDVLGAYAGWARPASVTSTI
ncbi:hypothetical protein EVAR_3571_1 [Eumeta japonica]|uniref:C2H2-type domain-containing protein n=1 Tax=Eumeta variegata TaxID=151549 RepID=A0A4C1SWB1_EUMVA|nr:hypothetical protein EVAR_3571_1 [Eumeta japonica]